MDSAPSLASSLRDLVSLLRLPRERGAAAVYDRVAARYDRHHRRWLRRGGAQTVAALEGCLLAELRPGAHLLDAGCGPGASARRLAAWQPRMTVTLLDAAPAMLSRAALGMPGARAVLGDVRALPFASDAFDVVTCAWVLETLPDAAARDRAVAELLRVTRPGGLLCLCFCTRPDAWRARCRALPMRLVMARCFRGRLLSASFPPPVPVRHGPPLAFHRLRYHEGLSAIACIRKQPEVSVHEGA